jgi:hypothetical protein
VISGFVDVAFCGQPYKISFTRQSAAKRLASKNLLSPCQFAKVWQFKLSTYLVELVLTNRNNEHINVKLRDAVKLSIRREYEQPAPAYLKISLVKAPASNC